MYLTSKKYAEVPDGSSLHSKSSFHIQTIHT